MKIKLTTPVLDYEGHEIPVENGKKLIIREAVVQALNYNEPGATQLAEDKARVYGISSKVYQKNEVDFTVDELAFIKEKAGKSLTPLVYGRLLEVIDPASE